MTAILDCISSYSLLESPIRIKDLVQTAKERGYQTIALTDINNMYGTVEFDQACRKEGMKPIFGMRLRYQKKECLYECVLLAKDQIGYRTLLKIATAAQEGEELKPLSFYLEKMQHMVLILPTLHGEWHEAVAKEEYDAARAHIQELQQNLDSSNQFYIELNTQIEQSIWKRLTMFLDMEQLPVIASEHIVYLNEEDAFEAEVLKAIATDSRIEHKKSKGPFWLKPATKWQGHCRKGWLKKAYETMLAVADTCQVTLCYHQGLLPKYPVPSNESAADYLRRLCLEGRQRVSRWGEAYEARLHHELSTIHEMGFDDYFLMVWDVLREARERSILTAPGRGSAAGSLVAYLLYITDVDPLEYQLLFERFLNPNRQTMPDIDLDFPDNRRDEMYEYVQEKYGASHVARIITFGTLAAKQVVRDVTRVFGLTRPDQDAWAKAVFVKAHDVKATLDQAYEDSYRLRQIVQKNERNQLIFEVARKLEGLPRNTGMHAAGVVIASENLTDYVPLQYNDDVSIALTQWPMGDVEAIGLLKMDFLSLRNLTIVADTLDTIYYQTGETVNIKEIPLDNKQVYEAFSRADTTGIFQFESRGMRRLLEKVKPQNIQDLALVNAIHRPGASLDPNEVMQRRFGQKMLTYPDSSLIPILKETYGIMVYQEQVMQTAGVFAGYTLAEADNLRRTMSKKKRESMEEEREPFINGAMAKGHSKAQAEKVYEQIAAFAGYGFNKSHAVAYSILAYQMMYLKQCYPIAFYTALLRSTAPHTKTYDEYIQNLKQQGICLGVPDINQSRLNTTSTSQMIRLGFNAIKGGDKAFIKALIEERTQNGVFQSLEDCLQRLPEKYQVEKYYLPLIEAGVFDSLNSNRYYLSINLDRMLQNAMLMRKNSLLIETYKLKLLDVQPWPLLKQLQLEKERLGFYVSAHPLDSYQSLKGWTQDVLLSQLKDRMQVRILAMVVSEEKRMTKQQQAMQKLVIETFSETFSAVAFNDALQNHGLLEDGEVYIIEGQFRSDRFGEQIVCHYWQKADKLIKQLAKKRYYLLLDENEWKQAKIFQSIQQLATSELGYPVVVVNEKTRQKVVLNERYWLPDNNATKQGLVRLLGEHRVAFQ